MPGLVPGIHDLLLCRSAKTWTAGSSPAMTKNKNRRVGKAKRAHHYTIGLDWWARRMRAFAHPTDCSKKVVDGRVKPGHDDGLVGRVSLRSTYPADIAQPSGFVVSRHLASAASTTSRV